MHLTKLFKTAVLLTTLIILTACGIPDEIAEVIENPDVEIVEEETAVSRPGYTRSNPLPANNAHTFDNWEVEVLDSVRGEKAYHAVLASNSFNDPPIDGMEYLLVKYRVRSLHRGNDEESIGLHITGDANVLHYSFDASAVSPDPSLDTYLPGGAVSEGWDVYQILIGEENLLVMVDDLSDYEQPDQYIALEEGNLVTVNEELLTSLTPTDVGTEPNQPALVGQVATTEDWQFSVLEIYSGDVAWERIIEANQFNDPPEDDQVYILIKLRLRYIGLEEAGVDVSSYNDTFALIDDESNRYDMPSVVEPEPELDGRLYPGGTIDGWLTFQAPESIIPESRLLFQPRTNPVENLRYLSLVDYGR